MIAQQPGQLLDLQQPELSQQELDEQQQQISNNNPILQKEKKKYMPPQFNKAKRTLNKIITNYFNDLKAEISKGARLFIDKSRIEGIINAIAYYVGVRYNEKKQFLQFTLKIAEETKTKEQRNGLFSYVAQSQTIINYNLDARVNSIKIDKGMFRLPDIATPVPFLDSIYFLDPCLFDGNRKIFIPSGPAFAIGYDGKARKAGDMILYRSKCAIVRDKQYIYLLGGYATQEKILTNRCEKYNPRIKKSEEMTPMNHKHKCPSACITNSKIWVFSTNYIEYHQKNQWFNVDVPFGFKSLPFQFVFSVNQEEILIFGGLLDNEKSCQIKIYNTRYNNLINYGPILPQGICNERSWGPCLIQGAVGVLSSIQAQVHPHVGIKSNMSQVIYILESSVYVNCILNV